MSDLYAGPGYPRVIDNRDGTRRIEYNADQIATSVRARSLPQLASAERPATYPGMKRVEGPQSYWVLYPSPYGGSPAYQFPQPTEAGLELSQVAIMIDLPLESRPDIDTRDIVEVGGEGTVDPNELPPSPPDTFNGSPSFYFHPDDMGLEVTKRRMAQGPTPGDPDAIPANVYPSGAGKGKYEQGTPGNPYQPWIDPESPYFGAPVANGGAPRFVDKDNELPAPAKDSAQAKAREDQANATAEALRTELLDARATLRDIANWPDMGGFEAGYMRQAAKDAVS